MEKRCAEEILACLSQERTPFHYYRDYYALQLLGYAAGDGAPLDVLRAGPFGRLLNKAPVRRVLSRCGDGRLDRARLQAHWEEGALPFLLTLGLWDGSRWSWRQTSRPGYNLVLRLNFTQDHDRRFRRLFAPYYEEASLNPWAAHPLLRRHERRYFRETLAWARIDVELERGEALIEEIQTDWIREAQDARRHLARDPAGGAAVTAEEARREASARRYLDHVLAPYVALWDEAMLSATLQFLREELGITSIWYHTWEAGNALKGIAPRSGPPRSLYTRLPRRFCFTETNQGPALLCNRHTERRLRKARAAPRFFALKL